MVQTFTCSVANCFKDEYSVVVLPEPVGPVTKIIRGYVVLVAANL